MPRTGDGIPAPDPLGLAESLTDGKVNDPLADEVRRNTPIPLPDLGN
jgi:hypothetical protein